MSTKLNWAITSLLSIGVCSLGVCAPQSQLPSVVKSDNAQSDDSQTSDSQTAAAKQLKAHVTKLASEFGERNLSKYAALGKSADWIEAQFKENGYAVNRQTFEVSNLDCHNIIAEKKGTKHPAKILIVGAHYDSVLGTPGANDNGSGTASLLLLAEWLKDFKSDYTIRFVAFTNEEPPYFQTQGKMGSWVYARQCRKNSDDIVGVISLETMGYFSDEEDSQNYPPLIANRYPKTGNFIGFVSNINSKDFTRSCYDSFKKHSSVPAEMANLPGAVPGVGWSDHWAFWQEGYVGLMVTDTAPFRYPDYHLKSDTPDKINYPTLASVVTGLRDVIKEISCPSEAAAKKSDSPAGK